MGKYLVNFVSHVEVDIPNINVIESEMTDNERNDVISNAVEEMEDISNFVTSIIRIDF